MALVVQIAQPHSKGHWKCLPPTPPSGHSKVKDQHPGGLDGEDKGTESYRRGTSERWRLWLWLEATPHLAGAPGRQATTTRLRPTNSTRKQSSYLLRRGFGGPLETRRVAPPTKWSSSRLGGRILPCNMYLLGAVVPRIRAVSHGPGFSSPLGFCLLAAGKFPSSIFSLAQQATPWGLAPGPVVKWQWEKGSPVPAGSWTKTGRSHAPGGTLNRGCRSPSKVIQPRWEIMWLGFPTAMLEEQSGWSDREWGASPCHPSVHFGHGHRWDIGNICHQPGAREQLPPPLLLLQ